MSDLLDTAGNRNPEARYAGYIGQEGFLTEGGPEDIKAAYAEGVAARESGAEIFGKSASELTSLLTIKEKVFCAYDGCEAVNGVGHSMYCEAAHEEHYIIMNQKL